jgi:hypothetical protein
MPRATLLLMLLWSAFVVRGFWYCALLPPWEGYDEPFHFAALQHVASGQGMPHAGTPISLEVQKSLHLLPLPWELQFQAIPPSLTTHDEFWKLPAAERQRRIDSVRELSPEEGSEPATEPVQNYESQQAPLYYWLFGVPLRWMGSLPLLSRIYLLRFLSLLLASAVVPLTYRIAKAVLHHELQAIGVTGIVVLSPELMINVARVGNESLALIVYSLLLASAVRVAQAPRSWRGWLLLGGALGVGLLTKAYFLTAVPAVVAVGAISLWSGSYAENSGRRIRGTLLRLGSALALAAVIAGKWYAQVRKATGSWSGQGDDVATRHVPLLEKLAAIAHVNWRSGILSVLISHVWFGGWSFLRVPNPIYVLAFVAVTLSFIGVLVRLSRRSEFPGARRDILVLAVFYVCFWVGLGYHVLVTYLNQDVSASTGWYLYATVAAEIVLLVWGLQAFLSGRIVFPALAVALATLDLYGMHALLMPYYTGLTSHVGGSVSTATSVTLTHLPMVFNRLAELRPTWMGSPMLLAWWIGYSLATLGTVLAVVFLFRRGPVEA